MERRSHDSSRLHTAQQGAHFYDENCYAKTASTTKAAASEPRRRVDYHSADCVTLRMAKAGREAGVRGAVGEVLDAVITMLPGWSRIRDNRVRLHQLVNLCPSRPHQRTVGRALRRLEDLQFFHYQPACGRGATALIVVHERFLHGIEELERDESGSVVVPFSAPYTSLFPTGKVPQPAPYEAASDAVPDTRPIEVPVDQAELQAVLDGLPPLFAELPRNLHWLLREELRKKLSRGHLPTEILRILEAPAPDGLNRPFKLAIWRLSQNMLGAGPRLRPLQRKWDQAQQVRDEQDRLAALAEDYHRVEEVTTPEEREELVVAMQELFGPAEDPRVAILTAVRRARRQYPDLPVSAAVATWLNLGDQRLKPRQAPAASAVTADRLESISAIWQQICAGCGNPGVTRPELPLATVACDDCLTAAAEELREEAA
jgi:hypothetical protein